MEVGHCRTCHRAMGFIAVSSRLSISPLGSSLPPARHASSTSHWQARVRLWLSVGLIGVTLAGCSSVGGFAGAAAGIATGAVTTNPIAGVVVGVTVQAATDAAISAVFRGMQHDEQLVIAQHAGKMEVGQKRAWLIKHRFPFGEQHGDLIVTRQIDNALAQCKEVAVAVISGTKAAPTTQWFITQVCQQSDGQWDWAAAEPATGRWGNLQ